RQGVEYYSELRALDAAERADIAVVLIDTSEGIVEQDLSVADVARKAQCSTIVVLSKWDLTTVGIDDVRPELERRLRQRPPHVAVSAKTGRGIERLLDLIERQFDKHVARVPTAELNRFLAELRERREPPSKHGKRLNLLYGAQVATRPPRFRFTVDDRGRRAVRRRRLRRARRAEPRLRRGCRGTTRRRAGPQPHEGPRPCHRRAAVDARAGAPGRGPLRPEHGGGDRRRAPLGGRDRERGPRPRRAPAGGDQLDDLPRLRQ